MSHSGHELAGRRVLVVEDDWFVADDVAVAIEARGAEVVGPTSTVEGALALVVGARAIDAALVDLYLHGDLAFPVADVLLERGVPFAFVTGYGAAEIPARYGHVRCYEKPESPAEIVKTLLGLTAAS